jgi:hypothetical protein
VVLLVVGRLDPYQRAEEAASREVGEIDRIFKRHYGGSAFDWSAEGVYVRLDADRFFTYSRTPKKFPA